MSFFPSPVLVFLRGNVKAAVRCLFDVDDLRESCADVVALDFRELVRQPKGIVDEVIPLMAEGKVLPYLDVPFQHASPALLKRMRRPAAQEKTLELYDQILNIVQWHVYNSQS